MIFSDQHVEANFVRSVAAIAKALGTIAEVATDSRDDSLAERKEYDRAGYRRRDDEPRRRADDVEPEEVS